MIAGTRSGSTAGKESPRRGRFHRRVESGRGNGSVYRLEFCSTRGARIMAKKKVPVRDARAESNSKMLKAVADLDRLKILNYLRAGTKNVSELADLLNAEIVNVSHHLGVLRETKLVQDTKKGR